MTDHDPLPDELAGLFAAERAASTGDPEVRAKVRSRLAPAVALLPGKAAAATGLATILGTGGKLVTIVAISIGVGVTAVAVTKQSHRPRAVAPAIEVVAAEETAVPPPHQVVQMAEPRSLPAPEPAPLAAPTPKVDPVAVPAEAKLLKRAWSALAGGDARQSLELMQEAERLHPEGALVEERQALRIQALVKLGQHAEARAAAEQFMNQFPQSVHRARVASAVEMETSP